ncbi:MAG: hypothetical protein JNN05_04605 [Candidatus Omnitrophica bacterium]|nr:hypothetical protein [Candidatus Omnitrophota bacterium]
MKIVRVIVFAVVLAFSYYGPVLVFADLGLGNIDKNENYDIYYGNTGGAESFIVSHVRIVRIDNINDQQFLVFVNDSGFNAKVKEGFILFSSIKAIVPNSTFTIRGREKY